MVDGPKMGSKSQQVLDALADVIRGRSEMSSLATSIAASRNDRTVRVPDVLLAALAWEARATRRRSKGAR
jgi:hypothetical protein